MINQSVLWAMFGGTVVFMLSRSGNSTRDLIKEFEGFREYLYDDQAGLYTIGWGHRVDMEKNPIFRVTRREAEKLLDQDIAIAQNTIADLVTVPLSENQLKALTSFVFNIGGTQFADSTMLKYLNAGDYLNAAKEFDKWQFITIQGEKVSEPALIRRRRKEFDIFIS